MVKKKNPAAAASSTSGGAAAKSSSSLPKGSAPSAPPPAPAPPAPSSSMVKPGDWIPIVSGNMHDSPDDTSEGRGSSIPVDFHTVEHTGLEDEYNGPIDFEVAHTDLPSSADDAGVADGSMRNDDADHDTFVDAAAEEARASPVKRSTGGFADEDDLFDIVLCLTISGKISFFLKDLRGVISSLEAFASQFTSLEADKARLQEEVKSSSLKLDGAVKIAAEARQEVDSLKVELGKLKEKLKEEEASRLVAEARAAKKDEVLRQSSLALLEAANIPADALDRVPNNSPANAMSMILASHQLTRELLVKGKGALARMHSMIFPKIKQEKTLGQLIDAFAVDTKEVIEVFKRTSRTYGAVLAFQLMMGYGFKGDIEEMTKELPKEQDGQLVDLSAFKASALTCARQLLELVFPVPSFVDNSSGALPESDRIPRMKDRITPMEKDLRSTYALDAIVHKKSEIAADVERYTLTELHKATESLNFPPTLLTLMSEFGNAKKVRDLVRAQVFAGAKCTLALVLARYPSACLLSIANATGDFEELYPKVLVPANIIVNRLEEESNVPEERETPQG
ncbi:hypothetical protein QYE76_054081 [Lolium multiflorum]|uniref:Uncharacterized protein n=1 Tax=Lolium multiflorum TaxID=4521 RepID=A0AAD8SXG7_LOLMU|nr:hypothetical protein QYE76_054081 [Lolium multiflorum]